MLFNNSHDNLLQAICNTQRASNNEAIYMFIYTRKKITALILSLTLTLLSFYGYAEKPKINQSFENKQWLRYPAISPDGSQIAFSHKGDIFLVSSAGGRARALTSNTAIDYMPVWSHDGKSLAFASNRHGNFDIFLMPAKGGVAKRLTYHSANDYPSDFSNDGKQVLFSSTRQDDVKSAQFPYSLQEELYQVSILGGTPTQLVTTPTLMARFAKDGRRLLYTDHKGYENEWRKHEVSSRSRDVWLMDSKSGKHKKLTSYAGDDRNAVWSADNSGYYYLSEKSGSFNIWYAKISSSKPRQITRLKRHPVRFLSNSNNDKLAFSYDGALYVKADKNSRAKKINVSFAMDDEFNATIRKTLSNKATEMAVSPNGKEVAFIVRGDIFVTSADFKTTKRITNTSTQERSVSFSPDGKSLLYAAERGNSWIIMTTKIKRDAEKYFALSTVLEEETIVNNGKETFQPAWSPDGKEIAFLQERTELKVINLESKKIRTILAAKKNYSYSDGDQHYAWSPDSKWFEVDFLEPGRWVSEIGIISADGKQKVKNISRSGYNDAGGSWSMDGNAIIWATDRQGLRSHGSWGSQFDIYAVFLNQKSFDKFNLNKEEYQNYQAQKKEQEKKQKATDSKGKHAKKTDKKEAVKNIKIDFNNIEDRFKRLTINSSDLADAILTNDGDKLFYLSKFEKGYDLWMHDFREGTTKIVSKLGAKEASFEIDKKGKHAFILADGKIKKIDLKDFKAKAVSFSATIEVNANDERKYFLRHIWRQVLKKFYDPKLHNVDWDYYWQSYSAKLDDINNNFDFAELASEMLGELNASHTGARFRLKSSQADKTASFGLFFDKNYQGEGLKVAEVIEQSPLIQADSKVKKGTIIEQINGTKITPAVNLFQLLNNQAGKPTLLSLYSKKQNKRWQEVVKPITRGRLALLLYKRWVKSRKAETERLSKGQVGYVHVKSMNDASFRKIYSELLGPLNNKKAVVVDTRFNGGGWLHDDLVTLLSGKRYMDFMPRGQYIGSDPMSKWYKPSIVVVGEGNYSDAHMFPYAYKALKIGKLVGMPVPGTGTAVWWEQLQTGDLVFGIPQVGMRGLDKKYLENQQLNPDILVDNDPESVAKGRDKQLEAAVKAMLRKIRYR